MKTLSVYGESIKVVTDYINDMLIDAEFDKGTITIYENNNGYWNVSKEKKPRKMESVILKQELIESVLKDVYEFI